MITIKSTACCMYCNKKYTSKTSLEKHMILCSLFHKSKRQLKKEEEEEEEIPSPKQVYKIIKELLWKIKKLEEKVEVQEKYINKTKKKINIIDWLQTNVSPESDYLDFISKNIIIKEEEILFFMQNTFFDTLDKIISENMENKTECRMPIFCFSQKQNIFYVFNKDNNNNNNNNQHKWEELNKIDCIKMFNIIYSIIFKKLLEWKKLNEEKICKSETLENIYIKTMGKLLSIDFKNETTLSKSKTSLFNYLKIDMKQIVEYNFE